MARIAGVNIPLNKRIEVGLTYIYGVGTSQARRMLLAAGVEPDRKVRDLTEDEVRKLRDAIDQNLTVEGDLRRER
jgi:small subunit ribosomal protein S13